MLQKCGWNAYRIKYAIFLWKYIYWNRQNSLFFFGTSCWNVNFPHGSYFINVVFLLLLFHKDTIIPPKIDKIHCKPSKYELS